MRLILSLFCFVLIMALGACRGSESESEESLRVTASTTLVADLASNVIGDRGEVGVILAASSDPHDYEPRPSDAQDLEAADLILSSGGEVDEWLDPLIESSSSDATVVTLIESVSARVADGGEVDPHWWQDPGNASLAVSRIAEELIALDREGEDVYARNANAYLKELEALDAAVRACIEKVPAEERKLVTSHDALGYYADRYGIEEIGTVIPARTTQAQASAGEVDGLIELIRDSDVQAIFPEAGVTTDLEETIADEASAEIGGEVWADALGPEGSSGETYIDAIVSNTQTLVAGFSGGSVRCEDLGA